MKITVDDPHKLINTVRLIHESEDVVVLYVDLSSDGKGAQVNGWGENCVHIESVKFDGVLTMISWSELPFDSYLPCASGGRYYIQIALTSKEVVARSIDDTLY